MWPKKVKNKKCNAKKAENLLVLLCYDHDYESKKPYAIHRNSLCPCRCHISLADAKVLDGVCWHTVRVCVFSLCVYITERSKENPHQRDRLYDSDT